MISVEDLRTALRKIRHELNTSDIVLIHTGASKRWGMDSRPPSEILRLLRFVPAGEDQGCERGLVPWPWFRAAAKRHLAIECRGTSSQLGEDPQAKRQQDAG
ncbi:MAG: cyclase family protein [Acidobacteriia bacterium]|nr:cyclase family protein [Terriglobia bacterium]